MALWCTGAVAEGGMWWKCVCVRERAMGWVREVASYHSRCYCRLLTAWQEERRQSCTFYNPIMSTGLNISYFSVSLCSSCLLMYKLNVDRTLGCIILWSDLQEICGLMCCLWTANPCALEMSMRLINLFKLFVFVIMLCLFLWHHMSYLWNVTVADLHGELLLRWVCIRLYGCCVSVCMAHCLTWTGLCTSSRGCVIVLVAVHCQARRSLLSASPKYVAGYLTWKCYLCIFL